jgi:hypothetical protein
VSGLTTRSATRRTGDGHGAIADGPVDLSADNDPDQPAQIGAADQSAASA